MTWPIAARSADQRFCVPCRVRGEPDDTAEQRDELATFDAKSAALCSLVNPTGRSTTRWQLSADHHLGCAEASSSRYLRGGLRRRLPRHRNASAVAASEKQDRI